jgi:uncharacterized protein
MASLPPITWTDEREEHIARHNVMPTEVEQVLFSRPRWKRPGENGSVLVYGRTDAGRYLFVVTAQADDGGTLIVTARDMTNTEHKTFRRKGN